jgi:hypothetical protein
MLIFIYNDIKEVTSKLYPNKPRKQRQLEREIICSQEGIVSRSELRLKTSAMRILSLINAGIEFDQIIKVGMNISDFEVENKYYNKFLLNLNLQSITELNRRVDHNGNVEPPKIPDISLKNILKISENSDKISEMEFDESM